MPAKCYIALLFAASFAGGASAGGAMTAVPKADDPAFQAEILQLHNVERRSMAIADLSWSPELAADAQAWASELARTGKMKHDGRSRHGENLAAGSTGRLTLAYLVNMWLAEKPRYVPGSTHPRTSTTGNWADVGHYTAMVWSNTRRIGCAVGRGQAMDFLVCRYDPPGNVRGYAAYDLSAARAYAAARLQPQAQPVKAQVKSVPAGTAPVPKPKPAGVKG
jgi:uncharacterized protein YkwD